MKQDFNVTLETKEIEAVFELDNVIQGSTTDHSQLSNRNIPDQHPIESITDLSETLINLDVQVNDLHTKIENTETWTFTLEDGSQVTKTIVLGS